jgi:hypothetical protein
MGAGVVGSGSAMGGINTRLELNKAISDSYGGYM